MVSRQIIFVVSAILTCSVQYTVAQDRIFLDKVELIGGLGINLPNSKDWSQYIYDTSNGQATYNTKSKIGHLFGISLIHSLRPKIEFQLKLAYETRNYSEIYSTYDINGILYSESLIYQDNNYITISFTPTFFPINDHSLHFFSGLSYSYLVSSIATGENYVNNQYVGGASINTKDGFESGLIDAVAGFGYLIPLSSKIQGIIRIQGNYGLTKTIDQNNLYLKVNSFFVSLGIRYLR